MCGGCVCVGMVCMEGVVCVCVGVRVQAFVCMCLQLCVRVSERVTKPKMADLEKSVL